MDHRVECPTNHLAVRHKMSVTEIWRKVCKNCEICGQLFFERLKEVMQYVGICRELECCNGCTCSIVLVIVQLCGFFMVCKGLFQDLDLFFFSLQSTDIAITVVIAMQMLTYSDYFQCVCVWCFLYSAYLFFCRQKPEQQYSFNANPIKSCHS